MFKDALSLQQTLTEATNKVDAKYFWGGSMVLLKFSEEGTSFSVYCIFIDKWFRKVAMIIFKSTFEVSVLNRQFHVHSNASKVVINVK